MVRPFLHEKLRLEPAAGEFKSNNGRAFAGGEATSKIPSADLEGELELGRRRISSIWSMLHIRPGAVVWPDAVAL